MGGRQNGVPRTRRGEQTTRNIEAGKSSPKHPPLTTQPTAPLFSSHPAKRAPDARKLGVGTPRSGSEHTAAPRLPALNLGLRALVPPLKSLARPGPGLARRLSLGSDPGHDPLQPPLSATSPASPYLQPRTPGAEEQPDPPAAAAAAAAAATAAGAPTAPCSASAPSAATPNHAEPGPRATTEEGGRRREEGCGRGGGRAGGRCWGPCLRDPRRLRVAAAAVSSAGSLGPLLGHRASSTAVAAAADSCSSRCRRLLPSPPARSSSSYRPPAEPRAACSKRQPRRCQPGLWPPVDPYPHTSLALASTPYPSYPKADRGSGSVPWMDIPATPLLFRNILQNLFKPNTPDPSLKTSLEASTTSQLLSRLIPKPSTRLTGYKPSQSPRHLQPSAAHLLSPRPILSRLRTPLLSAPIRASFWSLSPKFSMFVLHCLPLFLQDLGP